MKEFKLLKMRIARAGVTLEREEIKNVLEGKPDTVERYSKTFQCDMTYYATKTALSDGTGLGLAIVKHICAISDAELSIESEFGIGTAVTVVFGKSSNSPL